MKAYDIITEDIRAAIEKSIADAESMTSGEIRIHIEDECSIDPLERAAFIFEKLKMFETKDRNGVLFYLAVIDKKFAILGDSGIHKIVGQDFWNATNDEVISILKTGDIAKAMCAGVLDAGQKLKAHFPLEKSDRNELSDSISFHINE